MMFITNGSMVDKQWHTGELLPSLEPRASIQIYADEQEAAWLVAAIRAYAEKSREATK